MLRSGCQARVKGFPEHCCGDALTGASPADCGAGSKEWRFATFRLPTFSGRGLSIGSLPTSAQSHGPSPGIQDETAHLAEQTEANCPVSRSQSAGGIRRSWINVRCDSSRYPWQLVIATGIPGPDCTRLVWVRDCSASQLSVSSGSARFYISH